MVKNLLAPPSNFLPPPFNIPPQPAFSPKPNLPNKLFFNLPKIPSLSSPLVSPNSFSSLEPIYKAPTPKAPLLSTSEAVGFFFVNFPNNFFTPPPINLNTAPNPPKKSFNGAINKFKGPNNPCKLSLFLSKVSLIPLAIPLRTL